MGDAGSGGLVGGEGVEVLAWLLGGGLEHGRNEWKEMEGNEGWEWEWEWITGPPWRFLVYFCWSPSLFDHLVLLLVAYLLRRDRWTSMSLS